MGADVYEYLNERNKSMPCQMIPIHCPGEFKTKNNEALQVKKKDKLNTNIAYEILFYATIKTETMPQ